MKKNRKAFHIFDNKHVAFHYVYNCTENTTVPKYRLKQFFFGTYELFEPQCTNIACRQQYWYIPSFNIYILIALKTALNQTLLVHKL